MLWNRAFVLLIVASTVPSLIPRGRAKNIEGGRQEAAGFPHHTHNRVYRKHTYTGCFSSTSWFRVQLWCLNPTCYNCLRNRHFSHKQMLWTRAQQVQWLRAVLHAAAFRGSQHWFLNTLHFRNHQLHCNSSACTTAPKLFGKLGLLTWISLNFCNLQHF